MHRRTWIKIGATTVGLGMSPSLVASPDENNNLDKMAADQIRGRMFGHVKQMYGSSSFQIDRRIQFKDKDGPLLERQLVAENPAVININISGPPTHQDIAIYSLLPSKGSFGQIGRFQYSDNYAGEFTVRIKLPFFPRLSEVWAFGYDGATIIANKVEVKLTYACVIA